MAQKLDAVVLTALNEIAWLLNLRGGDVPYSPLVEGYVYLSLDRIVLFIQPTKTMELIREHLNSDNCQEETICVECVFDKNKKRWRCPMLACLEFPPNVDPSC
ncbi:hypothetical protein OUZ56_021610 [Daphnia magna]|uniref:Uncharacterized protein n=1 Tax=Daphnia magna TaxID=35525 RepID=A0ABR0AU28_9CRUS|nr:hypothetical protein OUZ56_021610 [Daphnia magna]